MLLRALNLLLCLVMLAFVAMQYNDPDGPLWMLYYTVPALWAGVMAWRRDLPQRPRWRAALGASLVVWAGLMVFYWPSMPGFWRKEVWWVEETAREGMGMMIAFAVVAFAAVQAATARRHR
ncbi:MAG: hypothetical protein HZC37_17205 [Burkholderiales bacterium]|nr:hypothetical protein [Burkholderiales bacterium]